MLKLNIDPTEILNACKDAQEEVKKVLSKSVKDLAKSAQQHIKELAKTELKSNVYQVFLKNKEGESNLRVDSIDENTHVITISGSAMWVEEGIPPNTDMKTASWLFKSDKTKTSKKGYKYLYVPFKHSKGPSQQTGYEKNLTDRIKFELKAQNKKRKANGLNPIPWAGIETYKSGKPKEGLLHEFDFEGGKVRSSWTSDPLERLRVYQAVEKDEKGKAKLTKSGKAKVSRSFMTFRTATENPKGKDKFIHPGFKAKKFMDRTADWAELEFYNKIVPDIFAKWKD